MSRSFNGNSANNINFGDAAPIDITGTALTVFFWFRPTDNSSVRQPVTKSGGSVSSVQYATELNVGNVAFAIGDAGDQDKVTGASTFSATTWHAFAGVKNGTGADALKVYLDGAQDGSVTSNRTIQNTANALIFGSRAAGDTNYDGMLAEVAIWDIALTAAEILALSKKLSPLYIRPANLKGYWPLFGSASPERDYSGQGTSGTINGTVPAADRHAPVMPFLLPVVPAKQEGIILAEAIPTFQQSRYSPSVGRQPHRLKRLRLPGPAADYETGIVLETVDAATVYVDIQVQSVELRESVDAATVYIDITNTGGECYTSFTAEFLGEGEAFLEFAAIADELEWSSSNDFLEWSPGVPIVEEVHC